MIRKGIEITWNNLTVKVGDKIILDNVSGQIKAGSAVGLLGPSGCGKTTLLSVLTGTCPSNLKVSGNVFFNNEKMTSEHPKNLISYVSQNLVNYQNLTAIESLLYCSSIKNKNDEIEKMANKILLEFGLKEHRNTFYKNLSGGQKLRLSIGMAVLMDTPVIILDEPTSGLDSASAMIVIEKMEELAKEGKTLLISIHQPSEEILELFDQFILMCKGNVVFSGIVSEAIEHFRSLGYENKKKSVNSAEFFSRLVSIDFRSPEKTTESAKIVENIKYSWKKRNIKYFPTNTKIEYIRKINPMKKYFYFNLLKFDFRNKKSTFAWLISILAFFGISYFLRDNIKAGFITYFIEMHNPILLKMDSISNKFKNEIFDSFDQNYINFIFRKITKNEFIEKVKKYKIQEYVEIIYNKNYDLGNNVVAKQLFGLFVQTMLSISNMTTGSAQAVLPIIKKELNAGIFSSFDITTIFLLHAIPYLSFPFAIVFYLLKCQFLIFSSIIFRTFICYNLIAMAIFLIELLVVSIVPVGTPFLGVFLLLAKVLLFSFQTITSALTENRPFENSILRFFMKSIFCVFSGCFRKDIKNFADTFIKLVLTNGFLFGLIILIFHFRLTNKINYKPIYFK